MIKTIVHFYEIIGLTGSHLRFVSALTIAILLVLSTVLLGAAVDKLEQVQMDILARVSNPHTAFVICNYVTAPGTVLHEIAHAVAAWATGAEVVNLALFEITDSGRLGHVEFKLKGNTLKKHWQLAIISCAPTLNGLLWMTMIAVLLPTKIAIITKILLIYIFISVLDHMSMSEVDLRNYLKGMTLIFPITLFLTYVLVFLST